MGQMIGNVGRTGRLGRTTENAGADGVGDGGGADGGCRGIGAEHGGVRRTMGGWSR